MVYRGKPSASCERCRSRRLKCDHGKPLCTPCIRARVECPGYRNRLDLSFRDQSEEVIRNSQLSKSKKLAGAPLTVASNATREPSSLVTTRTTINPEYGLAHSVQDMAKCHFFVNYMTGSPRCGHMSYLVPLIQNPRNSALNTAVNAVALAALSNIRLSPQTMLKAQREYSVALSKTNGALKDPVLCKADDTLAAVVLLGTYEVINCTDKSFMDRWMKHMDGAADLLEVRGLDQITRREGLDLFTQLRAQISLSRIYQERYSPPILARLTAEVEPYRDPNDRILDRLGTIIIRLTNFCADIKNGYVSEICDMMHTALSIDADLISLLISVPPSWNYTTVTVPMRDGRPITQAIWGSSYHVYKSIAASSMWNNYRSARIVIQEIIYDTLNNLESSGSQDVSYPQRHSLASQCRRTTIQLAEDICASVPFHFGSEGEDSHTSNTPFEELTERSNGYLDTMELPEPSASGLPITPGELDRSSTPLGPGIPRLDSEVSSGGSESSPPLLTHIPTSFEITGAGGLTLMWPLLVAANSGVASEDLRQWILNCLDKIGHSMGIRQALEMASLLREGMQSRAWLSPEYENPEYVI